MTHAQLSPGGQWWWTGDAWVAAAEHPEGIAALAALAAEQAAPAPVVPAQPVAPAPVLVAPDPVRAAVAPAPVPVAPAPAPVAPDSRITAGAPIAPAAPVVPEQPVAPDPVAEEPTFRPAGWMPPAEPTFAGSTAPAKSTMASLAKPLAFAGLAVGGIVLVVAVVIPAIHHGQKAVATTVNAPIVAAANIELKAVATNAAQAEAAAFAESNTYVGNAGLAAQGYRPTKNVTMTVVAADANHFCLKLTGLAQAVGWYDSNTSLLSSKPCH